uniref:Protein kinase domain-containing protein n=1 Tax=Panagrolaimus sp. JU765 TaxID=591449 RepID=A0AC34QWR8_9BILA
MDHPHIISYYDSFEQDGTLMIEMEYADGGTLAQFLARRQEYVAESEIMYMFEQMLSAVAYLHDNNVLHRDLKTANIFLTREKHVKIGDFGISKIMGTETRLAGGAQTVVGTPYYISPEMCEGKSYNVKSDIWALGCVLYEMACLQKTFEGSNLPALIGKIVKADYEQIKGPYSNDLKLLIEVPAHLFVINVKCGPDCTALITSCGTMIAMGSNRFNKLNLNTRMGFFSHLKRPQQEVENIVEPKVVKAFQSRIVDVSLSSYHSGVLLENGHVHVFGRNKYGELGLGHRQTQVDAWLAAYRPVKALCAKTCVQLVCGNGFTMVATGDNELYFWGTRGIKKKTNETVTIEDLEIERSSSPALRRFA